MQAGEEEFAHPQAALLHLNGDFFSLVLQPLLLCSLQEFTPGTALGTLGDGDPDGPQQ